VTVDIRNGMSSEERFGELGEGGVLSVCISRRFGREQLNAHAEMIHTRAPIVGVWHPTCSSVPGAFCFIDELPKISLSINTVVG